MKKVALCICCFFVQITVFAVDETKIPNYLIEYMKQESIPSNAIIYQRIEDSIGSVIKTIMGYTINLPTSGKIFFIDEYPTANWSHPCRYVWFDLNQKSIKTIKENWFPADDTDNWTLLCEGLATAINPKDAAFSATLFQNSPNPFSRETEIRYYLPENAGNAVLYVFSLNGNLMLTKPITQMGNGSIVISNSELSAGMYIYTLAINGVEVDSKRMILNRK